MDALDTKGKEKATDDALFTERLEMLFEQCLGNLRSFADREGRPFEEVRRRMAELHCKFLFGGILSQPSVDDHRERVRSVLEKVSREFESLETLAGVQSFFLVVNPHDSDDQGFLGGTVAGREFWRGHRGCGAPGAEAFKAQCMRITTQRPTAVPVQAILPTVQNTAPRKAPPAREIKNELYAGIRHALRTVSGVRKAEMKWTNHAKLVVYKVRINGWPDNIPVQNPSVLSSTQNKLLLELLREGKLYFSRLEDGSASETNAKDEVSSEREGEDAIFEDWLSEGTEGAGYEAPAPQDDSTRSSPAPSMLHADESQGMSQADNAETISTLKRKRVED
ncbi:hypothetical protein GSI_02307 [Ganoderma sinense ZZ0214-1]|uniref:Uncharacterized protein n=1 Tax=Ganoderma sinense ZZ0214-1 TaxID=1077348 RepID=A0A2G8SP92_9APHY|nr:hypothetical protein GSI_02307 [Ganoderma sinense ZZ0214-1]